MPPLAPQLDWDAVLVAASMATGTTAGYRASGTASTIATAAPMTMSPYPSRVVE